MTRSRVVPIMRTRARLKMSLALLSVLLLLLLVLCICRISFFLLIIIFFFLPFCIRFVVYGVPVPPYVLRSECVQIVRRTRRKTAICIQRERHVYSYVGHGTIDRNRRCEFNANISVLMVFFVHFSFIPFFVCFFFTTPFTKKTDSTEIRVRMPNIVSRVFNAPQTESVQRQQSF